MKRLSVILTGLILAAMLLLASVTAVAQAPDLYPSESIPTSAGELVDVSVLGSRADYYVCYTFREPGGKLTTYVFQVGGSRVTDASSMNFMLSHILHPMK
jgi:hypothetical protein